MTWPGCGAELAPRLGADGSFSLWSEAFGEGFHSGRGALREARETFLAPSQLERLPPGARLRVVEVCVGTGCNVALLLEACAARGIALEWWGLELDHRPLALALAAPAFRRAWQPATLSALAALLERGEWQGERGAARMVWGDARQGLAALLGEWRGRIDLVWHDAFSPRRCPQLWTVETLAAATALLAADGCWISYCSAAAVREALRLEGLRLVALELAPAEAAARGAWSGGTVASRQPLGPSPLWRELSAMERDHLASGAGEPYRDPSGRADAATILSRRAAAQAAALASGRRGPSSAWRRRWGL
ncbi:MAG: MnmC family methyltransferase [Cyanobacteriota bacterium]|nr:MnmC family methyltransferase [Cyanobacteriota bacterium]